MNKHMSLLREFSVPLVLGVIAALTMANLAPEQYHHLLHDPLFAGLSLHFVTNDLFMTFFFGIAAYLPSYRRPPLPDAASGWVKMSISEA